MDDTNSCHVPLAACCPGACCRLVLSLVEWQGQLLEAGVGDTLQLGDCSRVLYDWVCDSARGMGTPMET